MKTESIKQIESTYMIKPLSFSVGDTVAVNSIIREGDKQRTQIFKGIIIAVKRSGIRKTFTIRKISAGIGVEKIIPLNSPNIKSIKVIRKGSVRKAKLYYMRNRIGKRALKINDLNVNVEETESENPDESKVVAEVVTKSDEESK